MHQGKVSVLILRAKEKHRKILNNTILLQLGESHDLELTATGLIFFTKGQPMECRSVMIMNQPFGPVTWGRSVPKYSMPQTYKWQVSAYNDYFQRLKFNKTLWVFGPAQIKGTSDLLIAAHKLNATQKYYLTVADRNRFQVCTWVIYRVWVISAYRVRVRPLGVKSPKKTTYSLPTPPHQGVGEIGLPHFWQSSEKPWAQCFSNWGVHKMPPREHTLWVS